MEKELLIVQSVREMGEGGGVSGVAYHLEQQFQRMGYRCEKFTIENMGLRKNDHSHLLLRKIKLFFDVVAYTVLGTWMLYRKYHNQDHVVVISHNDSLYGDLYVMHGLHKSYILQSPNKLKMLIRNPLHLFLLLREEIRYRLKSHRVITTFSMVNKQDIMKHYPVKESEIRIIPNGVDVQKFRPSREERLKIRNELGIREEDFVLIFVGHEFERKGLIFVLEALRHLIQKGNPIKLIIAGNDDIRKPPYKQRLQALKDAVFYVGTRRDIERYYNASDAFVLPSTYETWALVGLEAMACGIPVLMTPTGGIKDYLKDGENGFFIKQEGQDIAEKVLFLIENEQKYREMSLAARQTALKYSWESIAEQYLELIKEIVQTKKKKKEAK